MPEQRKLRQKLDAWRAGVRASQTAQRNDLHNAGSYD